MVKLFLVGLLFGSRAFAQGEMVEAPIDGQEQVTVTGSRIYPVAVLPALVGDSLGPIAGSGGGSANPGLGKGSGDKGVWTAVKSKKDKDAINKRNKEAAAKDWGKDFIKKAAEGAIKVFESTLSFLDKLMDVQYQHTETEMGSSIYTYPDGTVVTRGGCKHSAERLGEGELPPNPCMNIRIAPVVIMNDDGTESLQAIVSMVKMDGCYTNEEYIMKCIPLDGYTFVVGSRRELADILNEITGTTKYE